MGFSVRLAPGVRVRASSRGIRTSLGPRVARVHVGAGRAGVSTGAGPIGFYTSLGGGSSQAGSPRRSSSGSTPQAAVSRLQGATKLEQAQQIADAISAIGALHRQDFAPAVAPVSPVVAVPPLAELQRELRSYALKRVSIFRRAKRAQAKAWADQEANAEHQRRLSDAAADRAKAQEELDASWSKLTANDPMAVISALAEAFEDNRAPAAPVGVSGDDLSLVVLVPGVDVLPERIPSVTEAGNLSLRKATKAQTAELYLTLVSAHVLVTVKEAFAVAPGITSASVVVVRHPRDDSYGAARVECILATRLRRAALRDIRWERSEASNVLVDAADEVLIRTKGQAREIVVLDVAQEPEIAAVLAAVDVERLVHPPRAPTGAKATTSIVDQ